MARRALLIGVNDYEYANKLSGCLNDVELFGGVLADRFGFDDITRVVDPDNRRDDILAAFDALVESTDSGDTVVVYYSGHGSQSPDVDGDEPDKWDETICPRDTGRGDAENRDITDDEINSVVQALGDKGAVINFIFDSCHSGSATRGDLRVPVPGSAVRWLIPARRAPEGAPHLQPNTKKTTATADDGWVPTGNHLFVSGCRAEELSNEYPVDGRQQGALTYQLCRQLSNGGGDLTWDSAVQAAREAVSQDFPDQHPTLEAPDDRRAAAPFAG